MQGKKGFSADCIYLWDKGEITIKGNSQGSSLLQRVGREEGGSPVTQVKGGGGLSEPKSKISDLSPLRHRQLFNISWVSSAYM